MREKIVIVRYMYAWHQYNKKKEVVGQKGMPVSLRNYEFLWPEWVK